MQSMHGKFMHDNRPQRSCIESQEGEFHAAAQTKQSC
jgi:hypothetical protein